MNACGLSHHKYVLLLCRHRNTNHSLISVLVILKTFIEVSLADSGHERPESLHDSGLANKIIQSSMLCVLLCGHSTALTQRDPTGIPQSSSTSYCKGVRQLTLFHVIGYSERNLIHLFNFTRRHAGDEATISYDQSCQALTTQPLI